ncbi:M24 family metallopeptidase [Clostridium senegalense]|uniref:M24 family metallopeptidase n=1 Tax=Clostridium senegalense TaxID=1465809 RepID=UPI001C0F3C00|nr:Xaa-Pro peptidase family protein [Clostridium senegalense]MBU5225313.1 Xaa-Pro peptidase family protein [Clostridium senegalense]
MYTKRLETLRKTMSENGLDGVLLQGDINRNYMSGFKGDESYSIITKDRAIFITDFRFTEQANQQVENYEIHEYQRPFETFLDKMVKELNIKKLGFEENVLTFDLYESYKNAVNCELIPLNGMVEKLRLIKSKDEIEAIKKAQQIADSAFEHMLEFIKPGMTEKEIGLELEFYMRKLGASGLSFPSIVASGVRSSLPHGTATEKVVERGDFLTLDFGAVYDGYCSDMTRTIVIGEPNDKMKEIYNIVLNAQEAALKAVKPGMSCFDLDKIARDIIKDAGYGEYFGHGLGHGVGRLIHEAPMVSFRSNEVLEPGMVITDEPGIYIPNFGGVRIEDLILVTEDGCEVLSKSPKNLICI